MFEKLKQIDLVIKKLSESNDEVERLVHYFANFGLFFVLLILQLIPILCCFLIMEWTVRLYRKFKK